MEELVARCLLSLNSRGADGLSEFLSAHADAAPEVADRISWLADMGLITLPTGADIQPSPDRGDVFRMLRESRDADDPVADDAEFGHYRIIEELGRGGQAVVYRADDTRLNRQVALKVMTGFGDFDDAALARFRREAEVASRLDDPGICTVYESGAFNKTAYIAMRLVDGETLAERIGRARDGDRNGPASLFFDIDDEEEESSADSETDTLPDRIDVTRTIEVVEAAARALHTAHEAGVIHRDIKPGNIIVSSDGSPVVLDFGLAGDTESDLNTLTREGDFFGTPAYMSPEQLAAHRIKVDRRTDVYSLGVLLYECVTLERPFQVPTREALYQAILTAEPPSPRAMNPAIPSDLEVVIATAMDKNRDRRYQTAEDLAEELRRVREHEPIQARPASAVTRLLRWTQRHPARATAAVATVLVLLISAALVTWSMGESQRATLSEAATLAEQKARNLERLRAEEAEAEREQLRAEERERVLRGRLLELATGEQVSDTRLDDMRATAREHALAYFDAFIAYGIPLMADDGADAVLRRLRQAGKDDAAFRDQIERSLYDAAMVLAQGGAAHAVAIRDGRPLPLLSPEQRQEFEAILKTAPESIARWDRLTKLLAADRNPWRRQIWAELISATEEGRSPDLGDLTSDQHLKEQTASSLVWLANALMSGADIIRIIDHASRIERVIDTALAKQSDDEATLFAAWCAKGGLRYFAALGIGASGSADAARSAKLDALRAFEVARDLSPHSYQPYSWIARINATLGRSEAARVAYERALQISPQHAAMTRVSYADGLFQGGNHFASLAVFQDLVEEEPEYAMFQRFLADALMVTGSLEKAAITYRKALKLDPSLADAYVNLSNLMLHGGDVEGAFQVLDRGMEALPGQRQIRNMMAKTLNRLRDSERSKDVVKRLRAAMPDSAEPYLLEGQVSGGSGRAALMAYQQGLKVDARSRESWVAVAQQHLMLGDYPESQATCRKGLAIWPDDLDLHRLLALSLWRDSKPKEAVDVGRAAIVLGVVGFDVNLAVGGSLTATGAFEESIPYLEAAVDAPSRSYKPSTAMSLLFMARLSTGDVDGALRTAERWAKAEPGSGGEVLAAKFEALHGDYDLALNKMRGRLSSRPEGSRARERVEDILAVQPVVRGVVEPETALDFLRLARAADHRWEFAHAVASFEEGYKRVKADPSMKIGRIRLAEGALSAARAATMMGRGLGREHVPPLAIRDAAGVPLRTAEGQVRFIDSRPAGLLRDLLDEAARDAANARAFGLLQICVDEALAGLSTAEDQGEIARLRGVFKTMMSDPFFVIFRHPPEGVPWATRATALIERVRVQRQR